MINKLRRKFICMNLSVITLILIAILATIIYSTAHNFSRNDLDFMRRLALDPPLSGQAGDRPPEDRHQSYLLLHLDPQGELSSEKNVRFSLPDDTDYDALIRTARTAKTTTVWEDDVPGPANGSSGADIRTGVLSGQQLRFLQVHNLTYGDTYVFLDISGSYAMLASLTRNCLLIGLGAFVLFLMISVWFARWAVRPVETAWEDQKQFIADASHELKTPLTIILTNAQLLRSPDFDDAQKQRFSENILETATRMRTLVEGLLDLSRADRTVLHSDATNLNLTELIEQQLCLYEPIYFEHGLTLQQELAPDVHVTGSASQLTQVLDILLDNADKYAASSSGITVRLERQRRSCLLSVTTAGEPLSTQEQQAIFKRFYRADRSHSDSGSYGLGLSIADTIVRAHHGEIYARGRDMHNTFFVRLSVYNGDF